MREVLTKIINYITRRKLLYKAVGWLMAISLISELATPGLPANLALDFESLSQEFHQLFALVVAWLVEFFLGGWDTWSVIIKLTILLVCLYIDYRVATKDSSKKSVWNIFIGAKIDVNQQYDLRDEEPD